MGEGGIGWGVVGCGGLANLRDSTAQRRPVVDLGRLIRFSYVTCFPCAGAAPGDRKSPFYFAI